MTSRGLERREIVSDDVDREKWCELLDRVATRCGWRVFAWARAMEAWAGRRRAESSATRPRGGRPIRASQGRRSNVRTVWRKNRPLRPDHMALP